MVHEKLRHLSQQQIEELMQRYYGFDRASDLIEEYEIDVNVNGLYKLFPPIIHETDVCPTCKVPLIKYRQSKTGYSRNIYHCPQCGHDDSSYCNCAACTTERERIRAEKRKQAAEARKLEEEQKKLVDARRRDLINTVYDLGKTKPVEYESLNLREKVYLGALLRLCLCEDMQYIRSYLSIEGELTPDGEFTAEIYNYLIDKRYIVVHPNSPLDAFAYQMREKIEVFKTLYIYKANYHLNLFSKEKDYKEIIRDLLFPKDLNVVDKKTAYLIWSDIAYYECLEYLYYQMDKVDFDFKAGEKTTMMIYELLYNFSVSEIYQIIYKCVTDASRFYVEKNITKQHAANSVISGCQRYAEKIINNNWNKYQYKRIPDLPQSMISEFFFNTVLKIDDLGFNMVPNEL